MKMSLIICLMLVAPSRAYFHHSKPRMTYVDMDENGATEGYCLVKTELVGEGCAGDDHCHTDTVTCPDGQVITFCECAEGGSCAGIRVNEAATACTADGQTDDEGMTYGFKGVRAMCGTVPGQVYSTRANTCGPGDTLLGCYILAYVDGGTYPETVPVVDGNTCYPYPGCGRECRIQITCYTPTTSNPAEYCPCLSVVVGPVVYNDDEVSEAVCPPGMVVTSCDCEMLTQPAMCGGVTYSNDAGTCRAHASAPDGEGIKARACCGKLGGSVVVVSEPPWPGHRANPAVECPRGYEMITCGAHTFSDEEYYDDRGHLQTVIVDNICQLHEQATFSCADCHLEAICWERPPCTGPLCWSDWSVWGACSETCDSGIQIKTRTCRSGEPGSQFCPGVDYEIRTCYWRSCSPSAEDVADRKAQMVCDRLTELNGVSGYGKELGYGSCNEVCSDKWRRCRQAFKIYPNPERRLDIQLTQVFEYPSCATEHSNACCCTY